MDDVVSRAQKRTQRAIYVVEELDLLGRWAQCGTPTLVGAARLGLVVSLDIDLNIYSENPSIKQGFAVISGIAPLQGVRRIRYSNCLDTIDQGLYWHIQYNDSLGETWSIDSWLVTPDHPHRGLVEGLIERLPRVLTTELRVAILTIKESLPPGSDARGVDVYEAVIDAGVRTPDEFTEWWQVRPRPEISEWLPSVDL